MRKYAVAPISGFFLMHSTGEMPSRPLYPKQLEYVFDMQNASSGVNAKCLEFYDKKGAGLPSKNRHRCMFANESYAHSVSPIFPLQSALDKWQLRNIYRYDSSCWSDPTLSNCTSAQVDRLNAYAHDLVADFKRTEKFSSAGAGIHRVLH